MKKADTEIDFTKDKINILEQDIDIKLTSSGHYWSYVSKTYEALNAYNENNTNKIVLSIENINNRTTNEKKRVTEKLHKQFGHASSLKMLELVKNSGIKDDELCNMVKKVKEERSICLKYKKASLKSVAGF